MIENNVFVKTFPIFLRLKYENLIRTCISSTVFSYSLGQYSPNLPTPYELKKVSSNQRNSIIGIISTIIAGLAVLGVVVCVIHTRRRPKHMREARLERYQVKMVDEVPNVPSSSPQPSAHCWEEISFTPQIQLTTGKQKFIKIHLWRANWWAFSAKNTKVWIKRGREWQ